MTVHLPSRVVARLDVKGDSLVKGVRLEGLRKMGDPAEHARRYYEQGADEIIYIDVVASLYGRNNLREIVERTAAEVFIPMIVGGGVRSADDVNSLLRAGADKVAINSAALARPALIAETSRVFGAQCIVVSIEAGRRPGGGWEAFTDNGREKTGIDALEWAERAVGLGAGEILLTSIDREGTRKGFDLELTRAVVARVGVPVIASGGAGCVDDVAAVLDVGVDAVAIASLLHYKVETVSSLKAGLAAKGVEVRL